jgi:hypothetical protein
MQTIDSMVLNLETFIDPQLPATSKAPCQQSRGDD